MPGDAEPAASSEVRALVHASLLDLPQRYVSARASPRTRRYRLRVRGCEAVVLVTHRDRCTVASDTDRPANGRVDAELCFPPEVWLAIVRGSMTGLDAFLAGHVELAGDLNEALRLETLFSPPGGSPAAAVQGGLYRHRVGSCMVETFEVGPVGAPTVLLLHGLGASKVSLLPAIGGLAADHRVIAADFPGFGASTAPVQARYDAGWLAAVTEGLLDAMGLERAVVVGNSMGGRVAVELALRAPERVAALGLLCPAVAFDEYRLVRPLLRASRLDIAAGAAPWPLTAAAVDAFIRSLFADPERLPVPNLVAARDDVLRILRSPRSRMALLAAARRLGMEDPRRFWPRLEGLIPPSLWLFGDRDRLVSCEYAELVRARLPQAVVEVWEDCGHVPQFEYPQGTVDRLRAFIRTGT